MSALTNVIEPALLALSLSMDAVAVAAARGLSVPAVRPSHAIKIALFFGGFQAFMPLLGWQVGAFAGPFVAAWQGPVAAALLVLLGLKMLREALVSGGDEAAIAGDPFGLTPLFGLAVATSIDAFAAGMTLPTLAVPPAFTIALIGVTTGVLSAIGLYAGRHLGRALGPRLEIAGGLVLVGLGLKVFLGPLL